MYPLGAASTRKTVWCLSITLPSLLPSSEPEVPTTAHVECLAFMSLPGSRWSIDGSIP